MGQPPWYREREFSHRDPPFTVGASYRSWPNGSVTEQIIYTRTGSEWGPSTIERTKDFTNPGPPYRSGSAFINSKATHSGNVVSGVCHVRVPYLASTFLNYLGGFVPNSFGPSPFSLSDMAGVGDLGTFSGSYGSPSPYSAKAYASAKPKFGEVELLRSVAELKDLPDSLRTTVKSAKDLYVEMGGEINTPFMTPKAVSQDFLNHVFGWAPTVGDVISTVSAYQNAQKTYDRLERNNGRYGKVHRRVVDSENVDLISTTYTPLVFPALSGQLLQPRLFEGHTCTGYTRHYSVRLEEAWFEGSFMYYLPAFDRKSPSSDGMIGRLMRLSRTYGFRISPVTVYQLTPWSWLADYFSNLGSVVSNLSSIGLDAVVNKYAFMMRHLTEKRRNDTTVFFRDGQNASGSWDQVIESKQRERAIPFGFDISMADLSAMQLAILATLGISRT
jgi:hypothetical protein